MEFIYRHEEALIEYGALKIRLAPGCILALKKQKPVQAPIAVQQIEPLHSNVPIFVVKNCSLKNAREYPVELSTLNAERFWSLMAQPGSTSFQSNVSELSKKTLFYNRVNRKRFSLHHVPRQSLLRLVNHSSTGFRPTLSLAHGPGAIFPLASAQHGLSSLVYHHVGGAHHWYVIPASERQDLQKILDDKNLSQCLDHGALFLDPTILEQHRIRYHRIIQHPNEFVVVSSGALSQSFASDTNWTESCVFALPSWIYHGHASAKLVSGNSSNGVSSVSMMVSETSNE